MEIFQNVMARAYQMHQQEYEDKALAVLRSGWYILGEEDKRFEAEFASYIGAPHCVGLANGLDALILAFRTLGVGTGDEVIVCANAYVACTMGISINGATPVFVEPDAYLNIDADQIEAAITDRTKAILAVHLFGQACDMQKILEITQRHRLYLVEDCAQSHGATFDGRKLGTFGDIACYSFYPTKNLGAFGDAGAITTASESLANQFRVLRNYGSEKRYHNQVVGVNSRLDELQAGLLRVRLSHLDALNGEREGLCMRYLAEIQNPAITLPQVRPGAKSVWHQFVIQSAHRQALIDHLEARKIHTIIHYPIPPHLSEAYRYLGHREGDFPLCELQARQVLSLPLYNGMTRAEQDTVIRALNEFSPS